MDSITMTERTRKIVDKKHCKHCGEIITLTADICPKCRYSQSTFWFYFERAIYFTSLGMLLISAMTLIFSFQQTRKAEQA